MNEQTQQMWLTRAAEARTLAAKIRDSAEERDLLMLADMYELVVKRFRQPGRRAPSFREWPPRNGGSGGA